MTFDDVQKILGGGDTAATDFFKRTTTDKLTAAFKPVVDRTMGEVGVVRTYKELMGRFEGIPFGQSQTLDVDDYVVGKALVGLFPLVGGPGRELPTSPPGRTSALVKAD